MFSASLCCALITALVCHTRRLHHFDAEQGELPACHDTCTGVATYGDPLTTFDGTINNPWTDTSAPTGGVEWCTGELGIMDCMTRLGAMACSFDVYSDLDAWDTATVYTGHYDGALDGAEFRGGHAVVCYGWGVMNGIDHWKCLNSWGSWGEYGRGEFYVRQSGARTPAQQTIRSSATDTYCVWPPSSGQIEKGGNTAEFETSGCSAADIDLSLLTASANVPTSPPSPPASPPPPPASPPPPTNPKVYTCADTVGATTFNAGASCAELTPCVAPHRAGPPLLRLNHITPRPHRIPATPPPRRRHVDPGGPAPTTRASGSSVP